MGGILHVEFATHDDASELTEFVQHGCLHLQNDPGSYWHHCSSGWCQHTDVGILGASFWDPQEALDLLNGLGDIDLIHAETFEWLQTITEDDGTKPEILTRSMHVITVEKECPA